jgi:hypothetical protein
LIVVPYDGLRRPSEISIENILLWVRLYDLPPAMMKEDFTRKLASQLGRYVTMDTRYPSYMRVRVEYPLSKALQPSLPVKIKGRGTMVITLRYENVPHFYFTCGCIGHAAMNCEEGEPMDQDIRFGEELRASPPRRVQQISTKQFTTRVSRSLFQVGARTLMQVAVSSQVESAAQDRDDKEATSHRNNLDQEHQDENQSVEGFQSLYLLSSWIVSRT